MSWQKTDVEIKVSQKTVGHFFFLFLVQTLDCMMSSQGCTAHLGCNHIEDFPKCTPPLFFNARPAIQVLMEGRPLIQHID